MDWVANLRTPLVLPDTITKKYNVPDMVIIEFEESFDFKLGVIQPACLPTQEISVDSLCYTSGWGLLSVNSLSPVNLQAVGVRISDIQGFMKDMAETSSL